MRGGLRGSRAAALILARRRASAVAGLVAAAALLGVGLAGCSQVEAVAPVGGGHEAEVRYAGIDVLLDAGVEVLVAPVCEANDGAVNCTGESVDGEAITFTSSKADATSVQVTVGETQLYSGSIMDVLDDAARATA